MFVGCRGVVEERHPIGFRAGETLVGGVKAFIELTGACGGLYRFDGISGASEAPSVAGNVVFARLSARAVEVVCCGLTVNLSEMISRRVSEIEPRDIQGIFVRFNTLRAARER